VLVETRRTMRVDASYSGAFTFSSSASDQVAGRLHVRDGDTVTLTYREPRDGAGLPREHSIRRTWSARTRTVDFRQVGLVSRADGSATVHGAQRAAPAGSLVRLYGSVSADAVVATATADGTGRFRIEAPAAALEDAVAVTAQEPGLPESGRLSVRRARITGQVVLPDADLGVESALIDTRAEGEPDPCAGRENCDSSTWLTDRDGRFYAIAGRSRFTGQPGRYDVLVDNQGVPEQAPWDAGAYGDSAPASVRLTDTATTADAGELPLLAPNLFGQVEDAAGIPVVEAMIDASDAGGEFVSNSYTRSDGRFALRLPDGDHRLRIRGPFGCVRYVETTRAVSVRDGIVTPADLRIVLQREDLGAGPWTIPLDPPPGGVIVTLDGAGLSLRLDGADGPGLLSVRCTERGWETVTTVAPPLELSWDGDFDQADVCLRYQPERAAQAGLDREQLQLLHRADDGEVTALTPGPGSEPTELCGSTDSFSSFAVGAVHTTPAPAPTPTGTSTPTPTPTPTGPPSPTPTPTPPGTSSPTPTPTPTGTSSPTRTSTPTPTPAGTSTSSAQPATAPQARATDDSCPARVPEDGFTDLPEGAAHEAAVDCVVWWRIAQGRRRPATHPQPPSRARRWRRSSPTS
jgi:hypothetical protein